MGFLTGNGVLIGNFFLIGDTCKHIQLQYTKFYTSFIFNFFLQCSSKFCKTFVCHHMKDIDVFVLNTFPILIDTKTKSTTYLLSASKSRFLLYQCADLEYIWIIPAFLQCRMGEYKTQWTVKTQQPFLIPHNGVIGIIVRLCISFCIFQLAFLILRKVTVMYLRNIRRKSIAYWLILWLCNQFLITGFKHFSINPWCSIFMTIFLYFVYKK